MDEALWSIEKYESFLEARKELLAREANRRFVDLHHGDDRWVDRHTTTSKISIPSVIGGIAGEEEELEIIVLNNWVSSLGLPEGEMSFDHADEETGEQKAIFDLAWPNGLQPGLSQPVAVLLNEGLQSRLQTPLDIVAFSLPLILGTTLKEKLFPKPIELDANLVTTRSFQI